MAFIDDVVRIQRELEHSLEWRIDGLAGQHLHDHALHPTRSTGRILPSFESRVLSYVAGYLLLKGIDPFRIYTQSGVQCVLGHEIEPTLVGGKVWVVLVESI